VRDRQAVYGARGERLPEAAGSRVRHRAERSEPLRQPLCCEAVLAPYTADRARSAMWLEKTNASTSIHALGERPANVVELA
jgi:hypothetical protein